MSSNKPQLLFANFNQDYSCISLGTKKGYCITNCDPFGRVYTRNDGAQSIVEMLFCTSLLALVGAADQPQSSPRKLQIVNTKRQSMICELLFPSSILSVKMNRKTLVVVLEAEIYIYDISNMKLLHVIETSPNPDAICELSPSSDSSYLVYPSPVPSPQSPLANATSSSSGSTDASTSQSSGDVLIFSTRTLTITNVVRAHKSPISSLAINSTGTLLATASGKGTVIRIWSLPGAEKLYQFRRGTREARIWSMCFNATSTLLGVVGDSGTVHVFKLGCGADERRGGSGGGEIGGTASPTGSYDSRDNPGGGGMEGGYEAFIDGKKKKSVGSILGRRSLQLTRGITSSMGGYLPNSLSEMWEPTRDFAWCKVPLPSNGGLNTRCVVGISATTPHIMVLSSDGYFYSYSIDLDNGGECTLMKQYSLLDSAEDTRVD